MFKVDTPKGQRYMVQLVGPSSYRMLDQITYRGQSLTVTKRTRDYLVRKTEGAWKDFDPTPLEDSFDPVYPPQFGEQGGPSLDMDDLDTTTNPAISMEHALALANKGDEVPTNDLDPVGIDTADLTQTASGAKEQGDGSGDLTNADLAKAPAKGGKTAAKPKTGGVKMTTKATPKPAGAVTVE